jgi:hypothetical protein
MHFCSSGRNFNHDFLDWLEELKITTATACDPGLASYNTNPLLLPMLVNNTPLSPIELEGWLTRGACGAPAPAKDIQFGNKRDWRSI